MQRSHLILSLLIFITLFVSCVEDDTYVVPPRQLITGIELRDDFGLDVGTIGVPSNNKAGRIKECAESNTILIFPNPAIHILSLHLHISCGKKLNIWAVKGEDVDEKPLTMNSVIASTVGGRFTKHFISNQLLVEGMETNYRLNLDNMPGGFYRLYVKMDDLLLWDDFYKLSEGERLEDISL